MSLIVFQGSLFCMFWTFTGIDSMTDFSSPIDPPLCGTLHVEGPGCSKFLLDTMRAWVSDLCITVIGRLTAYMRYATGDMWGFFVMICQGTRSWSSWQLNVATALTYGHVSMAVRLMQACCPHFSPFDSIIPLSDSHSFLRPARPHQHLTDYIL